VINKIEQFRRPILNGRTQLAAVLVISLFGIEAAIAETKELAAQPACSVKREVYLPSPQPGVSPVVGFQYLGKGLRLREFRCQQGKSDLTEKGMVRFSDDNGKTWTPFVPPDTGSEPQRQEKNFKEDGSWAFKFDPASHRTIEIIFQRIFMGEPSEMLHKFWKGEKTFYDHMMYRLSADDGRTWTAQQPIVYEAGAAFDPNNWANPAYLHSNEMYGGYDVTLLRDGRIAYPATVRIPHEDDDEDRKACANVPKYVASNGYVGGVSCFFGKWNKKKKDYDWTHSTPVFVPRRVSTRGLGEPAVAELKDGALLLDMRGANDGLDPMKYPGRTWISISKDAGKTWSPVTDLRYDTGEQFYSPSAFSKMIRSRKTGKLYWIGNISRQPPKGNRPRYPLYIAEVDEKIPALKKNTLTVIDDRSPEDTEAVQFSNFSLIENRKTRNLEIYLSRYGEKPDNTFSANAYKYTLTLR